MTDARGDSVDAFERPSPADVASVVARLGDLQHRRLFYEGLENPLWVTALAEAGAFASVPPLEVDDSSQWRARPWPEGDYLVRMAGTVSDAVAVVLADAAGTENPAVHRQIVAAAAQMASESAVRLVPAICHYLASERRHLLNEGDVASLIERLARGSQGGAAQRLAHAAYRPRAATGGRPSRYRRDEGVETGLEGYAYTETLWGVVKALVPVMGGKTLVMLCAWLEDYGLHSGRYKPASVINNSSMWRPSVAPHEQNYGRGSLFDALVDAVRDRALADVQAGEPLLDVITRVERSGQPLLKRIAMHVLAASVTISTEAAPLALERLVQPAALSVENRHEYAELARSVLPVLDDESRQRWEQVITTGPPWSDEKRRSLAARLSGMTAEDAEAEVCDAWQHKLLTAIGIDVLPPSLADRLNHLNETRGELDQLQSRFPSFVSGGWVGPQSPLTSEEAAAMSPAAVVSYLGTWSPAGEDHHGPTVEGLARTLKSDIERRLDAYVAIAEAFGDLEPTYARTLLMTVEEQLRQGRTIDWAPIVGLSRTVALKPDDPDSEVGLDQDVVWRFAQQAVADALGQGLTIENEVPSTLLDEVLRVLVPLTSHSDPTPSFERRYGGENMDPLTLSMNTTRPSAIRALARLTRRAKSTDDAEGGRLLVETLTVMGSRLDPAIDSSPAVAAVFGEVIGALADVDPEWLAEQLERVLVGQSQEAIAYADVLTTTALASFHPSVALLEALSPLVDRLLERMEAAKSIALGWRSDRSAAALIGDHLVMLLVRGDLDFGDSRLLRFFRAAGMGDRAAVLGRLGGALSHGEVPSDALKRARRLWDWRADEVRGGETEPSELAEFAWWIESGRFPAAWWLPRLVQVAGLPEFDEHGIVGEYLEAAARQDPDLALTALRALLRRDTVFWRRYDLVEHAPGILAAALDAAKPGLAEVARSTMDELGRDGHVRLDELVAARRQKLGPAS